MQSRYSANHPDSSRTKRQNWSAWKLDLGVISHRIELSESLWIAKSTYKILKQDMHLTSRIEKLADAEVYQD